MRYDRRVNMDSKAECGQLNVAHLARNKKYKKETITNKYQCPLSSVFTSSVCMYETRNIIINILIISLNV